MIPVSTAFIMNAGRVLLLLRPATAPTYPGRWSGVSGLVEPGETPEEAAVREAMEETGIRIRSLLPGRPFATDGFLVHPFLASADTDAVELEWENESYAWVAPERLREYDTVPGVRESFEELLERQKESNG